MTTKEILENSIIFIGPIGVGKSLLSSELAKVTGMDIVHLDELQEFAYAYSHGIKLYFDPIRKFFQMKGIIKDSNLEPQNAALTKTQKRLQKALIQEKFVEYKLYDSLIRGGFEGFIPVVEKVMERHTDTQVDYNRPTLSALLCDNICGVELMLPILQNLKKPIILDTGGPCFMDLSKYEKELTVDCKNSDEKAEIISQIKAVKKFVSSFGTRVYLKPSDYYLESRPYIIDYPLNQLLLKLDTYSPIANVTITPSDLFFDHKNKAFFSRENIEDIVSYETRQSLKNHDRIRELINIILLSRDNILAEGRKK